MIKRLTAQIPYKALTHIPYWVLIVPPLLLIIGLFFFGYCINNTNLYAPIAVLMSTTAALTAAVVTIKANRHTFMQNNSLSFQQSLLSDDEYKSSLKTVFKLAAQRSNIPIVSYAKPGADPEIVGAIRYVLNTWERAAASCNYNLYDEEHLYNCYKSMVIDLSIWFRDYLHKVQVDRNNPDLCHNFTSLALRWTLIRDKFSCPETKSKIIKIHAELNKVRAGTRPKMTRPEK